MSFALVVSGNPFGFVMYNFVKFLQHYHGAEIPEILQFQMEM